MALLSVYSKSVSQSAGKKVVKLAVVMVVTTAEQMVDPTEVHSANRMAATLGIQSAVSSGHHWAALREPHLAENLANRKAATSGIQSAVSSGHHWAEPYWAENSAHMMAV